MFATNESSLDRIIRLVLGIILFAVTFTMLTGIWQIVAGVLGVVMLATAAVGFCPLYRILGISTCPVRPASTH
ncbi:MAG: DUF2892 domain-containing protein [Roseiflexaceae bacterium]|nr:DUF2892 domain-containing protein [Roseiflexaceae bacterium]